MGDLWLFTECAKAQTRIKVNAAIDDMVRIVDDGVPKMVATADINGSRQHAAAAMLRRAVELLTAARVADNGPPTAPVIELAVRSIFEITARARFLLVCNDGPDEFVRMCHDHENREQKLATPTGNTAPGLPPFLSAAIAGTSAVTMRDLFAICQALDKHDGRKPGDSYSYEAGYNSMYRWFSNSATHSGLSSIKRFAREEAGVLHMIAKPEPLTTHWPIPLASAFTGEVAITVFAAFGMPTADLEATQVRLP